MDRPLVLKRFIARVRALLPGDWNGEPGKRFEVGVKKIAEKLIDKGKEYRLGEHAKKLRDLLWHALQGLSDRDYAGTINDFAKAEDKKIDAELKRRTLESEVREKEAIARSRESEARQAEITELEARLKLYDSFKERGLLPAWDSDGKVTISKPSSDYDWSSPAAGFLDCPADLDEET